MNDVRREARKGRDDFRRLMVGRKHGLGLAAVVLCVGVALYTARCVTLCC